MGKLVVANFNLKDWQRFLESPSGETTIPPERTAKKEDGGCQEEGESEKDNQRCPSPNFATLIDIIKSEGIAYRKEEQREDRGKNFREWITIGLIAFTFGAVCWQVHEMIKVYEPIRQQAEAAGQQAAAAKQQAESMAKQAETSAKEIVAASRAWLGPLTTTINSVQKDKALEGVVQYQNTGREPATDVLPNISTKIYLLDEWNSGTAAKEIIALAEKCLAISETQLPRGLQVVYPNIGFSTYQLHFDTNKGAEPDKIIVTDDMIAGKTIFKVQGCFIYRSIGSIHHSAFCYFYQGNSTSLPNLNICNVGNAAD